MNPFQEEKKPHPAIKALRVIGLLVLIIAGLGWLTTQPSCTHYPPTEQNVPVERLRAHVAMLSEDLVPRNYRFTDNLDQCADYISSHFRKAGADVTFQEYDVKRRTYKNVIAAFGPKSSEAFIVVGAHYDAYENTPGADDNASGVAGLIELAYLLGQADLQRRVEMVAFTLEEPPFFRTGNMGSARYAYGLKKQEVDVEVMICLEMIGCFSDEKKSQRFPSAILKLFYPDEGNYIAVVGSYGDRAFIKQVKNSMKGATDLPVRSMCAPKGTTGLDFSDHRNFWNYDYIAVMITDTAFYRNDAYHRSSDTLQRLDFNRMSKVVLGVYEAVARLSNNDDG